MSKILGLDLGTNSIGWALIDDEKNEIIGSGSRIIPMDQAELSDFDNGNLQSKTAKRTFFRGVRRLYNRNSLRRERLHRVLHLMGFLPSHYADKLDRFGKFTDYGEPKLSFNKGEFIFENSFNEMIADFAKHQPQLLTNKKGEACKIPHDWTIYYLRKKALTEKVTHEELAWILLNFNQKRGYYQLRGEDDDSQAKISKTRKEFITDTILSVTDTGETYKGLKVINIVLANALCGKVFKKEIPEWVGHNKNIIATFDLDKDGHDRLDESGVVSCRFSVPTDEDWEKEWKLVKLKTEKNLAESGKTVGAYIYDSLLADGNTKIRGKLVRTIERDFYKNELTQILQKQTELHDELRDQRLLKRCVEELYPHNEPHANALSAKDFAHLFIADILFYQRPLKSKKSLISNCRYEYREYVDKHGCTQKRFLKCIAKSHPLYQEFRVLQWLQNLKIYEREGVENGKLKLDIDVTDRFIPDRQSKADLFLWLFGHKEITQDALLKYPGFGISRGDVKRYRWNYVEDKKYPMNETRAMMLKALPKDRLTPDMELHLWHILYSISDRKELQKALTKFGERYALGGDFSEKAAMLPPFKNEYGAYSEKAIKKLVSLMRFHAVSEISPSVKERIGKIINGEADDTISAISREKFLGISDLESCQGMPLWLACYAVYGYHSELTETDKWNSPDDIDRFLAEFKQHELRNPIVEGVVTETLRTVRDLWRKNGAIDEIHIELGREMKNPADKRRKLTLQNGTNENTNLRLKLLLGELASAGDVAGVRDFSPSQLEILKIYEQDVLAANKELPDEIAKIARSASPSKSELIRYRLWLEQGYRSPYTGVVIPLSKLFTPFYQIEHIIPKKRYFDDSFSNKVICEAAINGEKSSMLGFEFIKKRGGEIVDGIKVFTLDEYESFVKERYRGNRQKMEKLLLDEIPEAFIERQLNDSRYISVYIKGLLSNIVRTHDESNAPTSKNVISLTGAITAKLKQEWGLNDVWNAIIYPRFERLNALTESALFGQWENKQGKRIFQVNVPLELQKGFNKKRIDHRHHALDALIIAAATRNHVNYLNNSNAAESKKNERYDLRALICEKDKSNKLRYRKPWNTFTQDAKNVLQDMIVSFKYQQRIINKTVNRTQKWVLNNENGQFEKRSIRQEGINWAIRQPLHKETVKGRVTIKRKKSVLLSAAIGNYQNIVYRPLKIHVKRLFEQGLDEKQVLKQFKDGEFKFNDMVVKKVDVYYFDDQFAASRVALDDTFDRKKIEQITDTGIQRILVKHLENGGDFSVDGIEVLNKHIKELNGGRDHKAIYKVRLYEAMGSKFPVGVRGAKSSKYVEAAKGTNLFFAIYVDDNNKRSFESIPLNVVVERQKEGLESVPEQMTGNNLLMTLSPGDLVYVPTEDELSSGVLNPKIDRSRIYKMMSCTSGQCFFIPYFIASPIVQTIELGSNNKSERAWSGEQIKSVCVKLSVDRLGRVTHIGQL